MTHERKQQNQAWAEVNQQDFVLDFNCTESFLRWWDNLFPLETGEERPIRRLGAGL